jgi:hypothetical protein
MRTILLLAGFAASTAPADPEEAIGKTPGVVEVICLVDLESAGSVEVGLQAAGLDFWKTEPTRAR